MVASNEQRATRDIYTEVSDLLNRYILVFVALVLVGCTAAPSPSAYTISGRVLDADGNGVPGVAIGITGGATGTVTTDEDGRWSFSGARGQVTVTPAHPDYEFDPPSRTIAGASGSVDFVAKMPLPDTDVRFVSTYAEVWWSHGQQHFIEYTVQNLGQAGQYKIEVYGRQVNVINPPWEFLGATELLSIGARGTEHSVHNLAIQMTLPYRYYTMRLDILVWTGSGWVKTDSTEVTVNR